MTPHTSTSPRSKTRERVRGISLAVALVTVASCAGPSSSPMLTSSIAPSTALRPLTVTPPSPDPRVGLDAGLFDAEEAAWNLRVVSKTPPPEQPT